MSSVRPNPSFQHQNLQQFSTVLNHNLNIPRSYKDILSLIPNKPINAIETRLLHHKITQIITPEKLPKETCFLSSALIESTVSNQNIDDISYSLQALNLDHPYSPDTKTPPIKGLDVDLYKKVTTAKHLVDIRFQNERFNKC